MRDRATICFHLRTAADDLARRLRNQALRARGIRVKLKRSDFQILTRQRQLAEATHASDVIYGCARALLSEFNDPGPFRLIGIAAYDLAPASADTQLDLLGQSSERGQRLDRVLDEVAERFGEHAIRRARTLERRTVLDSGINLDFLEDHSDE